MGKARGENTNSTIGLKGGEDPAPAEVSRPWEKHNPFVNFSGLNPA